jgi:hypothetical protein
MCLDSLKKFKTTGVGWKVVLIEDGKYMPPLQFRYMESYKKRGWNIDTNNNTLGFYDGKEKRILNYPIGYHIFVAKKDAKKFKARKEEIIRKVKYQEVVAIGTQKIVKRRFPFGKDMYIDAKVIVAKKFKFIRR